MTDFVAADCGIRQLHARFIDAVWRQHAEDFANCWASDGEWKIAGMHFKGRAQLAEASVKLLGRCEKIQLLSTPPILEVGEGGAQGRYHMVEMAKMLDGSGWITLGIYHDTYVEEDGRWVYATRFWDMQYRGPFDLSGSFLARPDFGSFPGAPGPDEQTYVRPVL